jgi:hypothetical protein
LQNNSAAYLELPVPLKYIPIISLITSYLVKLLCQIHSKFKITYKIFIFPNALGDSTNHNPTNTSTITITMSKIFF